MNALCALGFADLYGKSLHERLHCIRAWPYLRGFIAEVKRLIKFMEAKAHVRHVSRVNH